MREPTQPNEAAGGMSDSTEVLDAEWPIAATGRALVKLGIAMQDKSSTIEDIAILSLQAGLKFQFRISG